MSKRSLQRTANEIIEQLYVDEVIFALEDVIKLANTQINCMLESQGNEYSAI